MKLVQPGEAHRWVRGSGQRGGKLLTFCGQVSLNPWIQQVLSSQYEDPPCQACAAEDAACRLTGRVVVACKACGCSGLSQPHQWAGTMPGELPDPTERLQDIFAGKCPECRGRGFLRTSKSIAMLEFPHWPEDYE